MMENWEDVHFQALASIDRDMGIWHYHRCKIPGAMKLKTKNEMNSQVNNKIAMFTL